MKIGDDEDNGLHVQLLPRSALNHEVGPRLGHPTRERAHPLRATNRQRVSDSRCMPKSRPLCVHCVRAEGATDDHGIPVSWYPDGSQDNISRVKAPSCAACNTRLKRVEEEALIPLILSIDPCDPRAAGVAERVWRSMDPAAGRNDRDARAREAKKKRVTGAFFVPESSTGTFPGLGPEGRLPVAMKIRAGAVEEVGEKITRVVLYARYGAHVAVDRVVATHIVNRGPDEERIATLIRGGDRIDVPPGVLVAIRRAQDDPGTVMAVVDLWGHVRVFTSILPPGVASMTT